MTKVLRYFPWGQDDIQEGPVKIVGGSLRLKSKSILALCDVVGAPVCHSLLAVRLNLKDGAWVEVVFKSRDMVAQFRHECTTFLSKHAVRPAVVSPPLVDLPGGCAGCEKVNPVVDDVVVEGERPEKVSIVVGEGTGNVKRRRTGNIVSSAPVVTPFRDEARIGRFTQRSQEKVKETLSVPVVTPCRSETRIGKLTQPPQGKVEATLHLRTEVWVKERWKYLQVLGKTRMSEVHLGCNLQTGMHRALKVVNKNVSRMTMRHRGSSSVSLHSEVELLESLRHDNVVRLYESFETEDYLYLVMEFLPGGDLFHKIAKHGSLPLAQTRRLFRELCEAIQYLHSRGVVHRDLKLENILLTDSDCEIAHLKVGDLGISRRAQAEKDCSTFCGSLAYLAPEVVALRQSYLDGGVVTGMVRTPSAGGERASEGGDQDGYGRPADMWSLGVILYIMLCGVPPFDTEIHADSLCTNIANGTWAFDVPEWKTVPDEAKDLVRQLLTKDPRSRANVMHVLSHTWLQ